MKLNRPLRIAIGFATVWQALYPLLFLAVWLSMVPGMVDFELAPATAPEESIPFFPVAFLAIIPLHCLTMVLQIGLMGFYLAHIIKNTAASETLRIILGIGVFLMPFVAMPVYYYLYIWSDEPPEWAQKLAGNQRSQETNCPNGEDPDEPLVQTGSATGSAVPDSTVQE
ncbi:hypothetical protein ACFLTC_01380 [Chloroflexota bacterium]